MSNVFDVFAVLEGLTESTRIVKNLFLAKNYTEAKCYLKGYILENEKPQNFALYKVGTIDEKAKIYPTKIFICGGFEAKEEDKLLEEKKKYVQLNIMKFKDNYNKILEDRNRKTQAEIIETIFGGKRIEQAE